MSLYLDWVVFLFTQLTQILVIRVTFYGKKFVRQVSDEEICLSGKAVSSRKQCLSRTYFVALLPMYIRREYFLASFLKDNNDA